MKKLPNIMVLATGGTIAGSAADSTDLTGYQAGALQIDALLAAVPCLKDYANVSGKQIADIDSCNMTEDIWLTLAKTINHLLLEDTIDGIVITHGTDTMEETAYFLNLVVHSDKPVVLVGAMRPATAISADGPLNLLNAVRLAASPEAKNRGVLIAMNDEIHGARDVTKTSTFTVNTFKAPELGVLGYIINGSIKFYRQTTRRHTIQSSLTLPPENSGLPQVEIIYAHAGQSRLLVDAAAKGGARGIVYAGMGNGSIHKSAEEALMEAASQGIVIVRSSRAGNGAVVASYQQWEDHSFVKGDSLNPQKARILLALALLQTNVPSEIQRIFDEY